jgi:chlorite dismutase
MGQLVIEVPQNVNRSYRINDSEFGERLLNDLEDFERKTESEKVSAIVPPRRHSLKEDGDAVLGIWSKDEKTADEIARKVREQNRKIT